MDRRTTRTRQKLHESLLALLKQKPIEKITVKELCQLADINRSTFYQYYENPVSMLEQIQAEILEQLRAFLLDKKEMHTTDKLLWVTRYLYSKRQYADILLEIGREVPALSSLLLIVYHHDAQEWKRRYPDMAEQQAYYLFSFAAHGSKGILVDWMKRGFQEPPDQIAHLVEALCRKMLADEAGERKIPRVENND